MGDRFEKVRESAGGKIIYYRDLDTEELYMVNVTEGVANCEVFKTKHDKERNQLRCELADKRISHQVKYQVLLDEQDAENEYKSVLGEVEIHISESVFAIDKD